MGLRDERERAFWGELELEYLLLKCNNFDFGILLLDEEKQYQFHIRLPVSWSKQF